MKKKIIKVSKCAECTFCESTYFPGECNASYYCKILREKDSSGCWLYNIFESVGYNCPLKNGGISIVLEK